VCLPFAFIILSPGEVYTFKKKMSSFFKKIEGEESEETRWEG
jgi:hypothetical protein